MCVATLQNTAQDTPLLHFLIQSASSLQPITQIHTHIKMSINGPVHHALPAQHLAQGGAGAGAGQGRQVAWGPDVQ